MFEGSETKRLKIAKLTDAYRDELITFFNHPEAVKFFNPIENVEEFVDLWLDRLNMRYEKHGIGFYALLDKETGDFIGQSGALIQTLDGEETTHHEVGYHIMPQHWRKGYASEAAQFFRNQVFEKGLADEVISIIHVDNHPSKGVARNNGMKVKRNAQFRGWPVDVFAITRQEWEKL